MSCPIGVSLSESFVEASANQGEYQTRWYLPSLSLERGLTQVVDNLGISHNEVQIFLHDRVMWNIYNRRLGSAPVVLTTEGFEDWLQLSLPPQPKNYFSSHPQRQRCPFQAEWVFGISERVTAEGQIEKTIDHSDLEFLKSKLELFSSEPVIAIGFLHSNKNNTNEKTAAEYFRQQGYEVYTSYELGEGFNERHRWWNSILNAYLAPTYEEYRQERMSELLNTFNEEQIQWATPRPNYLDFLFSTSSLLKTKVKASTDYYLYLGLEEFLLVENLSANQSIWHSDFGPVALSHPESFRLQLQPLQKIDPNPLGGISFTNEQAGFEPGPMCFGRGLQPTFLDLIQFQWNLESLKGLDELIKTDSRPRYEETLRSLSGAQNVSAKELQQSLLDIGLSQAAMEIESQIPNQKILAVGPLAKILTPQLNQKLPTSKITCADNSDMILADSLLLENGARYA